MHRELAATTYRVIEGQHNGLLQIARLSRNQGAGDELSAHGDFHHAAVGEEEQRAGDHAVQHAGGRWRTAALVGQRPRVEFGRILGHGASSGPACILLYHSCEDVDGARCHVTRSCPHRTRGGLFLGLACQILKSSAGDEARCDNSHLPCANAHSR